MERAVRVEPDGTITITVDKIRRIDIEDILTVSSHSVRCEAGLLTHEIEFSSGGKVRIVYDEHGKLREFGGALPGIAISEGNVVILRDAPVADAWISSAMELKRAE